MADLYRSFGYDSKVLQRESGGRARAFWSELSASFAILADRAQPNLGSVAARRFTSAVLWSQKRRCRGWACLEKVDTDLGRGCEVDGWLLFERHRGEVTERAVVPRTVVEAFDVIEDDRLRGTTVNGFS